MRTPPALVRARLKRVSQLIYDRARVIGALRLVVIFTIVGVILRLYVASVLSVDGDEGQFVYQGQRALQGALPLRDLIPNPDPLYVWLVALMELFVGPTLWAVRALSLIFSGVAILSVYFLTSQLARKRIALLATIIYALSPTIILYNSIGNYRQVAWPLVIVAMCFLNSGLKKMNWKSLFVFGVMMGLATVTYRVTAIFVITAPLLMVSSHWGRLKVLRKPIAAVLGGVLSAFVPVIGLIVSLSSISWVNRVWGVGGGVGSASSFAIANSSDAPIYLGLTSEFDFLSRIGFIVAREWFYLILPAAIGAAYLLKSGSLKWLSLGFPFSFAFILVTIMVSRGQFLPPNPDFGAYSAPPPYDYTTILFLWLGVWGIFGFTRYVVSGRVTPHARGLLLYWVLSLVAASLLFRFFHVFYFIAFAAPLAILSGYGIQVLYENLRTVPRGVLNPRRIFPLLIISVIALSAATASVVIYTTPIKERDVTQAQAAMIGDYIKVRSGPQDEILTGNLIYVVSSGRNNALNISNPWVYRQASDDPFPGNPFGTTPSVTQLASHLGTGSVKYVIMDPQLIQIMVQHGSLMDAVYSHFTLETTLFNIQIYRFHL